MKNILSLSAGIFLLLVSGYAYAEDTLPPAGDRSCRMITNEELPTLSPEEGGATFNQMKAEPGAEGSAAGGTNSDGNAGRKESGRKDRAAERTPAKTDVGGPAEEPYTPGY